ncbi:MAG TPA: DUF4070 domain-containing protein [Armatimonadota bacterium]|jgi:radical SAM superfamily enzyme YgiQ (UPF0313 family)
MKALLVYPEYPETFWSFKHALKFIAKRAVYPPLGLLTVAAMLPTDWEPRLIDMNVTPLRDEDLQWADIVLISAMSVQTPAVHEVIARSKACGKRIIAGGPLFTSLPDDFAEVDYLVLNEAEVTLPQFLHDFSHGHARHCYASTERADLRTTPIPRWELIKLRHYSSMNLQMSRGCPFDCEFCNITSLFGRTPRIKSTAQVLAELDRLSTLGWRGNVFFVDDNFIGPQAQVKHEILPAIITWMRHHRYPFTFNTQLSLNLADDAELMSLLSKARFATVFIGIESPHAASLLECNKIPNNNRDLLASIRTIHRAGLQVQAGFIVGFDSDPVSIFEQLIKFIQESGVVTAMVGLLNAMPGTRLFQRLQHQHRLLGDTTGDNTDYTMNFAPMMAPKTLLEGYQKIIESIYAPNAYYLRVKQFLHDYHPRQQHRRTFKVNLLATVWKTTWRLGLIEKERSYFWRLLFWSLFHRPRLLPLAMVLSVYGFHFRKSFEFHQAAVSR